MERTLAELEKNPERYLNDFDEIKKILEGEPTEEKIEEWLNELLCHLNIWQRYTTALRDTGKVSLR